MKYFLILFVMLIAGCSQPPNITYEKSFELEDAQVLAYMQYVKELKYKKASDTLLSLFEKSNKPEYLLLKLQIDANHLNKYKASIQTLDDYIKDYPQISKEASLVGFKISSKAKKYKKSLHYSLQHLKHSKDAMAYLNVANSYILLEQLRKSLPYLERVYEITKNENVLDKMTYIMYLYKDKKEQALSYLETHIRKYEISEKIAKRLLSIYKETNNIEGMISVYKRLIIKYPKHEYSEILISLYILQNKKQELIDFLLNNTVSIDVFTSLYRYIDSKKERYKIAMEQYKKSNNVDFLAQAAMVEYDMSLDSPDDYNATSVVDKLRLVVDAYDENNANADYLNYLGYVMINDTNDTKEGISFVQKALLKNPDSVYYLDSLAWGYYKIKKYKKALSIMKKIINKMDVVDKEIGFHMQKIKSSLKKKKK